ncbi:hypothetical protein BBH88_03855 [Planococcus antarcticus DSM 14505]|uniref:PAS domain-containing protein n=1 Tax=Planococcus antarcticus DSM 14505 TaxID=1185653 RepID=A0ABM6D268_9BACL|nr:hypothetical protein [Planococcus antarcticus]ANU09500.1 hypothetical protein BBH88_03855 [Planococcus antarcticus DSM 14505]
MLGNNDSQTQEWLNAMDEFLIIMDTNGIILYANQPWVDFCTTHGLLSRKWTQKNCSFSSKTLSRSA